VVGGSLHLYIYDSRKTFEVSNEGNCFSAEGSASIASGSRVEPNSRGPKNSTNPRSG